MRSWQMLFGGAAIGVMVLAGCASKTTQADQDMLNQVKEYSQMTEQNAQAAQASADKATAAADRAEAAANRAESAASAAEQSALKAARAFEMKQMK